MENSPQNPVTRIFCPYPGCQKRGRRCMECRAGTKDPWAKRPPGGRPKNEALALAKLMGDMLYLGGECGRCGGTERYTRNSSCVQCARSRSTEGTAARKAALAHDNELARVCHTTSCDSEAIDSEDQKGDWHAVTPDSETLGAENMGVEVEEDAFSRDTPSDADGFIDESVDQGSCDSGVPACHGNHDGEESDADVDSAPEPVYLRQDQIPQPWD